MKNWLITLPKKTPWGEYEKELATVADRSSVMNYKTRYIPKTMKVGDRCYLVWDGQVRGWMEITGLVDRAKPWTCTTTGQQWGAGKYIQRSGTFHKVDGPEYTGFRGIREFDPDSAGRVATKHLQEDT